LLREGEEALDVEIDAEHLVDGCEHPQAAGAVQVQEVAVRDRAAQHQIREDEHEALFHVRPRIAHHPSNREQQDRGHDPPREHLALPAARRPPSPKPLARARDGRGIVAGAHHRAETIAHSSQRRAGAARPRW
jgi:hypothetical protein